MSTISECYILDSSKLMRDIRRGIVELEKLRGIKHSKASITRNAMRFISDYTLKLQSKNTGVISEYPISSTDCQLKYGRRFYLLCPSCWNRAGKLYMPNGLSRFVCRKCYPIKYDSQMSNNSYWDLIYWSLKVSEKKPPRTMYFKGEMTKRFERYYKQQLKAKAIIGGFNEQGS